ncbi:armadillo-type protein [Radiomyces spectabilis]|uniref:armadillo-type protein n=1 Tax=Radiomyces spectabilis TaxID=64574 RepID=UPI00221EE6DF|nr:armadillo-type protein [Radiomyces spectabilis]KAI8379771.1 armadillo-type protein [Radiomyces spectabilis]
MLMEVDSSTAPQSLTFNDTLVTSSSKPIRADELVRRLQKLHEELQNLDQENVVKSSLDKVSKDLVHAQLLKHKNATVKAITACCLADILRLFAPDAPYSEAQLKKIFELFIAQLQFIKSSDHRDFRYHFYLLESLSTVKSVIIIADLGNSEELTLNFFMLFFNTINANQPRNVQMCMLDILVQLTEEAGPLSQDVIELLLEQFDDKVKEKNEPAYFLALELCRVCVDVLQRRICQYFTDTLMAVSRNSGSSQELEELKKVHELIRKVHSVVPGLLLSVIPQLEEEMKLDNVHVRQIATQTIGNMLAEKNSTLYEQYPSIWKTFLRRQNDKMVSLRVQWLEHCVPLYRNNPSLIADLNDSLKKKLSDPEEKVRAATCQVIGDIDSEVDPTHMDKEVLEKLALRCKDKKASVRKGAMDALGSIYNKAYGRIAAQDRPVVEKVGWIPGTILSCLYVDEPAVMSGVESTMVSFILPENPDDEERTERLVTVFGHLEQRARVAFLALIRKQKIFSEVLRKFINVCEQSREDDEMDEDTERKSADLMNHISGQFADRARTINSLRRFMEIDDEEVLRLLKSSINPDSSYNRICNAKKSLLERLEQLSPALYEIFELILNRACPSLLNVECIPHLLKMLQSTRLRRSTSHNQPSKIAQDLLKEISATYPTMYQTYTQDLIKNVLSEHSSLMADDSLELLAQISRTPPKVSTYNDVTLRRLFAYIREGNVTRAEHAAVILSNIEEVEEVCGELVKNLCTELSLSNPYLLASLNSLSQFALYSPQLLSDQMDDVLEFMQNDVFTQNMIADESNNPEWMSYDELAETSKQKLTGLRLLVNYLIGAAATEGEQHERLTASIFNLSWDFMNCSSDTAISNSFSAAEYSHLRLAAVQSLIKLTQLERYQDQLSVPKFERIALALQDPCYFVRAELAETLMKGLQVGHIHPRYYAVLFLCAHEPETELLKQIKYFLQKRAVKFSAGQAYSLETSFVRLLHMLAHHPDFGVSTEELLEFLPYIEFYLSCVANADNVSFLYHVAQKIKSSTDMVSNELSQNSYVLSDLACLLIKRKCRNASWPLNAYPKHINLQSKIYRTLPSSSIQAETLKNVYLPEELIRMIETDALQKSSEKRNTTRTGGQSISKRPRNA